ncbi:iron ABC transporter permease [Limnohabitans sp. Bal53]|uniref:ABC transporter permease n=1 Tax=Limnohabitans sp. Bal53 TaxID=1977910 RepID=UPI000D3D0A54|nr:iron ABC transporter permease [Limnohabitans sp. Bal53]PUE41614.1 ABC transporter permease [Limnohabitans sp. Bal53]
MTPTRFFTSNTARLRQRRLSLWLAAGPALFVLALLALPVARLLWQGLWGEPLAGLAVHDTGPWWLDAHVQWRLGWTLVQALVTCVLCLVLGLPMAWVLARLEFKGRMAWQRALMLPFVVPTLVASLGILALWGPQGLLGTPLAQAGWTLEGSPWLLLLGNLFFNLSLVVRAGMDGLAQVSAQRVAAARTLGATPWRAFWRVEWPVLAPWLASALCLVFLYCLTGFGLALVLGGQRWATVEVEIYTLIAHELALAQAASLAVAMLALTGGMAWVYAWVERRLASPARVIPVPRRPVRGLAIRGGWALALGGWLLLCGAPLLALLLQALEAVWAGQGWLVLVEEDTWLALGNTLRFTLMALVLATAMGVLQALAGQAMGRWAPAALVWRASAYAPLVVSPVALAFGLLLLYPQWLASLPLLVAAYALLAYPFVAKALTAALDALPAQYAHAAATLGARPLRVFWRVTLPLVAPALRRGMAFAAATMLGEFAVSLLLSRPEWLTLSTLIYQRLGRPGSANLDAALVLCAGLMALALIAFWLIEGRGEHHRVPHQD